MAKSLYETLEVNDNATPAEIKKSYRRLARKYHPDINKSKDAEEKFKEINAAYEVLNDPNKKNEYDQYGDSMFGGQNFHDFARGHAGDGIDLNDILKSMFGGATHGFGNSGFDHGGFSQPNLDLQSQITIAFDTSILGGKHHIAIKGENFDIKIPL